MGLWIAIFITLVVFGSVLWVKPSPREKMLTALRSQALLKGYKVRLLDAKLAANLFSWIDNYRQFVLYEKTLPSGAKPHSHKAIVIRITEDPNAHELDEQNPLRKALVDCVDFAILPKTAEALVISASGISIVWREYGEDERGEFEQLESIDTFLNKCTLYSKLWT